METNTLDTPKLLNEKKSRIWELDFLRGICVLLMIWDHFMYNIAFIFGDAWGTEGFLNFAIDYWTGGLRTFFHPIIYCIFFVLCGISCTFSRDNLGRGIKALILAFIITVVTSIFNSTIKFGVLHMLAFAMLIYYIINTLCRQNKRATSIACFVIGTAILIINLNYTNFPPDEIPEGWAFMADWLMDGMYISADYFPILPNVGYVLIGASVGGYWYNEKKSLLPKLDAHGWYKPVSFWGRIALPVYILHQPVIIGILSFISYLAIGDWIFF